MTKLIKETCSYTSKRKPNPIKIYHVVAEERDDNLLMNYCPMQQKTVRHYFQCHACQYLGEGGD